MGGTARSVFLTLALAACALHGAEASSQTSEIDTRDAALGPGSQEPAVEPGGTFVTLGDARYVAAEGGGIAVLDVSDPSAPVVLDVLLPGKDVVGLQVVDGRVVAILADLSVTVFDVSLPHEPVPVAQQEAGEPSIEATVVGVDKGWVELDAGSEDGVESGTRFAIRDRPGARPVAIVVVSDVTPGTSAGPIPPRGHAKPGYQAVAVAEAWRAKHWLVATVPVPVTTFKLDLRPIVGAGSGSGGGGLLVHLELFRDFSKPWTVGIVISPAGFGVSGAGTGAVFELGAAGGYSGRYFGIQLGIGGHLSAGLGDNRFLIFLRSRVGPAGGVHVMLRASFVLPDQYWYAPSTLSGILYMPVRPSLDLFVDASGGNRGLIEHGRSGWANLLVGVRALVHGTGGPGTVLLSLGMGHGYVWDEMCEDGEGREIPCKGGSAFGPLASLGVEWRF